MFSMSFKLVLALLPMLLVSIGDRAVAVEKRVALVIGNSAYRHTAPLANPRNDAADIAAALKGLGFEVVQGLDLTKAEMDRTIRSFAETLASARVGLFFYAGHGLQVAGENYLVPVDARLTTASALDFEMIRLALVQRVMERTTSTNIVFLDACRDNPLVRNLARAMGTRSASIGRGLAGVEAGVGTLISFSTQPGNVALDGSGRNSPYAGALVEQLSLAHSDLSAILIDVRNKVIADTGNRQVPWEHSSLRARFYFQEPPAEPAGQNRRLQASEAAEVWRVTKDSDSESVLRAFISRYASTVFAELAKARLNELVAAVPGGMRDPSGLPAKPSHHTANGRLEGTYDGNWRVTVTAGHGAKCPQNSFEFPILINRSQVSGGPRMQGGSVSASGEISFSHAVKYKRGRVVEYAGKVEGDRGRLEMKVPGGPCFGTAVLTRVQ